MACKWLNVCPLRKLEKKEKISERWKKEYCESRENWKNCKRYKLTKKGKPHSDKLLPDGNYAN